MLKTQITGAKYLSPQTNQMTNLNIAVPADSKDTKFGTSDILLAKDVVAYLNALDSDISKELDTQTDKINKINESIKQLVDHNLIKIVTELPTTDIDKNCIYLVPNKDGEGNNVFVEYIYVESKNTFEEVGRIQAKVDLSDYYTKEETDNQIQIAKNSAINIHNEDNTKSIKLDINDAEALDKYDSTVNVLLYDPDHGGIANINAYDGFRHSSSDENFSNLYVDGLYINNGSCYADIGASSITINDNNVTKSIDISTNKKLTEEEQEDGDSVVDISLIDGNCKANINAITGFIHKTDDGYTSNLNGSGLYMDDGNYNVQIYPNQITLFANADNLISLNAFDEFNRIAIGSDIKFTISRPADNTEGATITGVKSLTAFANPSATKVWATDGSTVDVLLKKSASGGYYIETNSNQLGWGAFAANFQCTASGSSSFAEGCSAKALAAYAHAEGYGTIANGTSTHAEGESTQATQPYAHAEGYHTLAKNTGSHAEGCYTVSNGYYSHAEGYHTLASGYYAHAQGTYNVDDKNAIHSVGIGNNTTRKNAEYIYAKNNTNGTAIVDDPKNGYKYLIGVGGYDGISTDNTTYKSVQEVIADLTARIEQLETKVRALEAANTPA